jgi:hypothetical protein
MATVVLVEELPERRFRKVDAESPRGHRARRSTTLDRPRVIEVASDRPSGRAVLRFTNSPLATT